MLINFCLFENLLICVLFQNTFYISRNLDLRGRKARKVPKILPEPKRKNLLAVNLLKVSWYEHLKNSKTIYRIFSFLFLGSKSGSGKSKSSSANSSPKHPYTATSSSAMSAAEKRVQMMKKKATKKTDKKK